jgi:hypothetical protein
MDREAAGSVLNYICFYVSLSAPEADAVAGTNLFSAGELDERLPNDYGERGGSG